MTVIGALRLKLGAMLGNGVVRSVSVLVGGTAFAQALAVLALPLLTRLYSPEDFSLLAIYASLLGILGAIACLRLEIAIPIPERDEEAINLLALALAFAVVFAALSAVFLWLFGPWLLQVISQAEFQPYLWLVPLGVWLSGTYAALQYWATRRKQFPLIARTRMVQSLGGVGTQVGLGMAGVVPFGLLVGYAINTGAGILGISRDLLKHHRGLLRQVSLHRMRVALSDYQRFPRYSSFEALANAGGIQLPVILIAALAAGPEAGFLLLATRVMAAPMALVGGAVAQVYLSKAPAEYRAGRLDRFTETMIGGLVKTGVGPLLFAGIVAPVAFPLVFGQQWARAGDVVTYMTPWFIMQFVTSPVSMSLHVLDRQAAAFALQLFGLVLRVGAVISAAIFFSSGLTEIYAASGFLFYLAYFLVVARVCGMKPMRLLKESKSGIGYLIAWVAAAVTALLVLVEIRDSLP